MAIEQQVMWTALPKGVAGGRLSVSVLVSPRLRADASHPTLAGHFPDFERWWEKAITWQVQFGNGPLRNATRVGDPPRQDLWEALFPPDTFVRKHAFPSLANKMIRSFPTLNVMSFLKSRWLEVATAAPEVFPNVDVLLANDAFGRIAFMSNRADLKKERALINDVKNLLSQNKVMPPAPPSPAMDFAQLRHFYAPMAQKITQTKPEGTYSAFQRVALSPPTIDFHQMVTMLAQHPELMRALGLVHDIELNLPPGLQSPNEVRVVPTWTPVTANSEDVTPGTRCFVTGTVFAPRQRPSNPEIQSGKLRLADEFNDGRPMYDLLQIDVDGAGLKSLSFANTLARSKIKKHKTTDTPKSFSLPSLRSVGLGIAKAGRANRLHLDLVSATQKNQKIENNAPNDPAVFSAEDLVRGYAIDVFDEEKGRWFPLCHREADAIFTGAEPDIVVPVTDEGWVSKPGLMGSADGTSPNERKAHESMVRWAGWSLVAPRPGKSVNPDEQAENVPNEVAGALKLTVDYEPEPGSLPALRYGREYRMRARMMDLAGNGSPFGSPTSLDFIHTLGPEKLGRFDPIPSPAMLFRSPKTEGESLERLVIRSNYNTPSPDTIAVDRHVAAPKTDQFMAELLGMFDGTGGMNTSLYDMIAAREDGSFGELDDGGNYVHADAQADPDNYDQPYFDTNELQFDVENGNTARLPYLADPLSRGTAFRGLPGAPGLQHYSFAPVTGPWPDTVPFRLRLTERNSLGNTSGPPVMTGNMLEVIASKASAAEVLISSYLDPDDLDLMGLWDWIDSKPGLSQANKNALRAMIEAGTHWMFTPFRKLRLIHAVRQPLVAPVFNDLKVEKQLGKTFASLRDISTISRKSTERIDVRGSWTDVTDFLDGDTGIWEPAKQTDVDAVAFQVPVPLAGLENQMLVDGRHEFHDTHYRNVDYSEVATTRFREFFVERQEIVFAAGETHDLETQWPGPAAGDNGLGVVPESEVVKSPDGGTTFVRDADYEMDYPAGTIKRKAGGDMPPNFTAKVQYLVPPISRTTAAPTNRDVLNSARPDAPKLLYIVPTFQWEETPLDNGGVQKERTGNGLRVYLDRPWWSSGAGELLGVVLWPQARSGQIQALPSDKAKPFVTQWGMDPLWRSNATTKLVSTADFTASSPSQKRNGLTLEEVPSTKFSVAGHDVVPTSEISSDESASDRLLWFADIDLAQGNSYMPFIRLALARFQPKSVPDAYLSRVALADFNQLTPDRSLTVTYNQADTEASISVVGRSYKKGPMDSAGPAVIEVHLEARDPEAPPEEEHIGWIPVEGAKVTLSAGNGPNSLTVWSGQLPLPGGRAPGQRLVIREFERIPKGVLPTQIPKPDLVRRMVFAAVVPLSE